MRKRQMKVGKQRGSVRMCVNLWVNVGSNTAPVQPAYLLIKAVFLLNDKRVVQTPGQSSYGTEQGGEHQKRKGLRDLVLWAKAKASCHRTSRIPQKRDSTQEQDQLQREQKFKVQLLPTSQESADYYTFHSYNPGI